MESIEVNLKKIRESKHLSQRYVADLMNITQSAYARLENGKTQLRIDYLKAFANAVEMSLTDVIMYPEVWTRVDENSNQKSKLIQDTPRAMEVSELLVECEHYKTKSELLEKENSKQQETIIFLRDLVKELTTKKRINSSH